MAEHDIGAERCTSSAAASQALVSRRFDFLILDFAQPGITDLLEPARNRSTCNVVVGMVGSSEQVKSAHERRVHLVAQKPFTAALVTRVVKAAQSLLLAGRRMSYRHVVKIKARVSLLSGGERRELNAAMLHDISQGGVCLHTDPALPKDALVALDFPLPDTQDSIQSNGRVVWCGANGMAGVHFESISSQNAKKLREWSSARSPWSVEAIANTNCGQTQLTRNLSQEFVPQFGRISRM